ncbi:uncharacterized protein M421DRAFT_101376 [Didymella exigua CBS 183.55]|uniref:Alpha/beta-hydrolase n=1 Tax=Didymella exigua CBS 183.55 TaxID=1150837 RepID=A0A6A5RI40_9PLEO|nr:uncharacterized protein M421DRAFT_101376 [Didymella exigua CBS 183.55]KAF1928001.1 hypothetical protein M421DRAFT_101376 [Didymella exigua CBS 183.55]
MPFGPFILQWHVPSPNPPNPSAPLSKGITRHSISTSSGPLELLSAIPTDTNYRGHGNSWYPGFWRMYFTSRGTMRQDLSAGVREVEKLGTERRKAEEKARVVMIAHSAGGALGQYALSRGTAVPGFGSWSVYKFWSLTAPIHFPYRMFHPRYILAMTQQVHDAFFTPSTPNYVVKGLESLLSLYESMLWPMQVLFSFVSGLDVAGAIVGWSLRKAPEPNGSSGVAPRLLVLAGKKDVLCTPGILEDAANRHSAAFHHCVRAGKLDGISEDDVGRGDKGVIFAVTEGLGHHLQNHVEWERGAKEVLEWAEQL